MTAKKLLCAHFCIICSEDSDKLQSDLDRLAEYCDDNGLFLNLAKCNSIMFSRNLNQIAQVYKIKNTPLDKTINIKDRGVIFDNKLIFDSYVESVVNSASKMLGYVTKKLIFFSRFILMSPRGL